MNKKFLLIIKAKDGSNHHKHLTGMGIRFIADMMSYQCLFKNEERLEECKEILKQKNINFEIEEEEIK